MEYRGERETNGDDGVNERRLYRNAEGIRGHYGRRDDQQKKGPDKRLSRPRERGTTDVVFHEQPSALPAGAGWLKFSSRGC